MNVNLLPSKRKRFARVHQLLGGMYQRYRHLCYAAPVACGIISLSACSLSDLVEVDNPVTFVTPDAISNVQGAMGLYAGTVSLLSKAYGDAYGDVITSGIFTDEFQDSTSKGLGFDSRIEFNVTFAMWENYARQQRVRTQGLQAIAAMRKFPDAIPSPLIGRMYATIGYIELVLAERYCSGVPLADIHPGGGAVTYSRGLTTNEMFAQAIAHFDTAIALIGADSLRYRHFANVGKGRALMGMGKYADARESVKNVPTDFVFNAEFAVPDTNTARIHAGGSRVFVSNGAEGINGINWNAAQDPRVPITHVVQGNLRSSKYATATSPIAIADGIEARLIEAEADLKDSKPQWLATLNQLRARLVDGADARVLADTTDPGTVAGRVNLLFYERAFWLYATGHRHGDMRRLVRQYQRDVNTVFPTGFYTPVRPNTVAEYGTTVVFPIQTNGITNPYYKGCIDKNA